MLSAAHAILVLSAGERVPSRIPLRDVDVVPCHPELGDHCYAASHSSDTDANSTLWLRLRVPSNRSCGLSHDMPCVRCRVECWDKRCLVNVANVSSMFSAHDIQRKTGFQAGRVSRHQLVLDQNLDRLSKRWTATNTGSGKQKHCETRRPPDRATNQRGSFQQQTKTTLARGTDVMLCRSKA